jgi:hypothetical protein
MMFRRLLVGAAVGATIVVAVGLPTGADAASGCVMAGTAKFAQPLKLNPGPGSYTFSGTLKNCTQGGVPKSATITASGSGSLACRGSKTSGSATIRWANGATSTLNYTTGGAANVVTVTGKIGSGLLAGQKATAVIAFTSTTPTADKCATTGVNSAAFNGLASVGVA